MKLIEKLFFVLIMVIMITPIVNAGLCSESYEAMIKVKFEAYESIQETPTDATYFKVLKRRYQFPLGREESNLYIKQFQVENRQEDCETKAFDISFYINDTIKHKSGSIKVPILKPKEIYTLQLKGTPTRTDWPDANYSDSKGNDLRITPIPVRESGIFNFAARNSQGKPFGFMILGENPSRDNILFGGDHKLRSLSLLDATNLDLADESIKTTRSSRNWSIAIGITSLFALILVTTVSVKVMKNTSKEQIENQNNIEDEKQQGILDGLKQNVNIIEDNFKGHRKEFSKGTFDTTKNKNTLILPSYYINELDPKYYATNLALNLNNKSTKELKKLIFGVNDKIKQINDTIRTIKELYYFGKFEKAMEIRDGLVCGDGPYEDLRKLIEKLKEEYKNSGG